MNNSPALPCGFIATTAQLERLTITGPAASREALLDWLSANGYRVVRAGPFTNAALWPRVDPERLLYVVERVVQK